LSVFFMEQIANRETIWCFVFDLVAI